MIVATLLWLRFYTHHGEKIETPNFMGLSIEEATELAESNNLRLGVDSVFSSKPLNTVITQNPVPHSDSTESWVKRERIIYLTVVRKTRQKIKLPHIKDKHKSLASSRLAISGLTPKWEYVASPYKNAVLEVKYKGKKIKTGHLLPKGSVVTVILGKGKGTAAQISLPNLVGKTISEANMAVISGIIHSFNPRYCEIRNSSPVKFELSKNSILIPAETVLNTSRKINKLKNTPNQSQVLKLNLEFDFLL